VNTASRRELGQQSAGTEIRGSVPRPRAGSKTAALGSIQPANSGRLPVRTVVYGHFGAAARFRSRRKTGGSVVKIETVPAGTGAGFPAPANAHLACPFVTSQRASSSIWHRKKINGRERVLAVRR
jgi:hypothetical protein